MLEEIIVELLYTNNFVIIPKFGAFIANYKQAVVNESQTKMYPPSYQIVFNSQIKNNDAVLINAVATKLNITYAEAQNKVAGFATNLTLTLKENNNIIINNIGRLYLDEQSNILFESFENNFSIQNYGLPVIYTQPISRLKDAIPFVINEENKIVPNKKSKKVHVLLLLFGVFFLSLSFIVGNRILENKHYLVSSISGVISNINFTKYFENIRATLKIKNTSTRNTDTTTHYDVHTLNTTESTWLYDDTVITNTHADTLPIINNTTISNAYICVGAFQNISNARKLLKNARANGMKAKLHKSSYSTLFRVLILTEPTKISEDMQAIRTKINGGAWLYCNDCSF